MSWVFVENLLITSHILFSSLWYACSYSSKQSRLNWRFFSLFRRAVIFACFHCVDMAHVALVRCFTCPKSFRAGHPALGVKPPGSLIFCFLEFDLSYITNSFTCLCYKIIVCFDNIICTCHIDHVIFKLFSIKLEIVDHDLLGYPCPIGEGGNGQWVDCNWTLFKITRQPFLKRQSWQSLGCRNHTVQKPEKSNMATRQPFRKWGHWKSIGSYPYT